MKGLLAISRLRNTQTNKRTSFLPSDTSPLEVRGAHRTKELEGHRLFDQKLVSNGFDFGSGESLRVCFAFKAQQIGFKHLDPIGFILFATECTQRVRLNYKQRIVHIKHINHLNKRITP